MGGIIEKITDFIKEMLQGWILTNLEMMFYDVNTKVGTIAEEVSKTPSSWNVSIFTMVKSLSENVIIPIAGMIITFVLCYELITIVMEKNNMHEVDGSLFFKYLLKASIAVWILSHAFELTMAVFDVGNYMVLKAGNSIHGSTAIDVQTALITMFENQISIMEIGELIALGVETMIRSLCMKIMAVLITVILYGRMIEAYFYISISPIPFATWTNKEWGTIGSNYFKNLFALAIQGFFIMVCVAIYSVLVSNITIATNLHSALWSVAAYTIILCFSLLKTGSFAKSIVNAT